MRRPTLAAVALLAGLAACARVGPVSRPSPDGTSRIYSVAALTFEAPSTWSAEGDARSVKLKAPGGDAVVEARASAVPGADAGCLEKAGQALERGAGALTSVRRHVSTFAGRKAIAQEGDRAGWHGWAWATCDGGEQYRVFLAGRTPVSGETVELQRRLLASARIGGKP